MFLVFFSLIFEEMNWSFGSAIGKQGLVLDAPKLIHFNLQVAATLWFLVEFVEFDTT